jgi:hypothetical protein
MPQADIKPAADEGAHGVRPVVLERAGDFVAHHVAQHAAEHAGDDAHQHRDQGRHLQQQRLVHAGGGEQAQAECIGPLDGALGELEVALAQEHHRQHAQGQHGPQHIDMAHPEKRTLVQQQVAHGAAAESREETDHAHADRVEPLARRLQHAGERERGGGAEFDQQSHCLAPGLNILHGPIVGPCRRGPKAFAATDGPLPHPAPRGRARWRHR